MKTGLLDGKNEISEFLNNASDYKLKQWVEAGMPVLIDGNRWLAHSKNIEEFFIAYTRRRADPKQITTQAKSHIKSL